VTDGTAHYILSNNHVLATKNKSQLVIQPGLTDLNCIQNSEYGVAEGVTYIPISRSSNTVDAGVARTIRGDVDSNGTIFNIGSVAAGGAVTPSLILQLQKLAPHHLPHYRNRDRSKRYDKGQQSEILQSDVSRAPRLSKIRLRSDPPASATLATPARLS